MVYYTKDKKSINICKSEKIGEGTQGIVYKVNNDLCAKVYKEESCKYNPEIFNILKSLNLENYCKLYDLLYNDQNNSEIMGYTMKFYQDNNINIFDMPTDYMIDSFIKLYESVKKLASLGIIAKDTIPANSIMTNNGIILIDFDSSCYSDMSFKRVLEINTNNILYFFRRLFERDLEKRNIKIDDEIKMYLNDIFAYTLDPVKSLQRKMAYTKTPLEVMPFKCRY